MKVMEKDNEITALERLLISHSRDLQKFIYTLTSDSTAIEDILQSTIATAFANLKKLKNPDMMKSWVFNIAKTETSHYFRQHNAVGFRRGIDVLTDNIEVSETDILEKVVEREFNEEIRVLINQLEEKYIKIILLHYYYDLELKEIAELYKINYSTVRTNHKRGIEKLKELYEARVKR